LVGLGPKFLDNGSQPSLNGSPLNVHTNLVWDQGLKPTFENFSPLPLKIWLGKTSNLPQIIEDSHQSETRNFETAQHIDEHITDVSSTINALLNGGPTKLEAITGF